MYMHGAILPCQYSTPFYKASISASPEGTRCIVSYARVLNIECSVYIFTFLLHSRCHLCPAQYPTGQALAMHKQTYHKEVDTFGPSSGIELALPVVDLKSPQVLNRLSSLGIQSYIPLSQLSAQTGGYFGLPIITIDGARNPNTCNLGALGATSILSLGPLKHLSNR